MNEWEQEEKNADKSTHTHNKFVSRALKFKKIHSFIQQKKNPI